MDAATVELSDWTWDEEILVNFKQSLLCHKFILLKKETYQSFEQWFQPGRASVYPLSTFVGLKVHLYQTGIRLLNFGSPPIEKLLAF